MAVGALGFAGVGVESSAGVNSAAIIDFIPFTRESITVTREDLPDPSIANQWARRKVYNGQQRVGGQLECILDPWAAGYLFRAAFDACSATTLAGGSATQHRFWTANGQFQCGSGSDLPTLTMEINRGPCMNNGSSFLYYNMAGNQCEVRAQAGQFLTMMVDFVGRDYSRGARSTPSYKNPAAFLWSQCSLSLAGVGQTIFQNVTIRVDNKIEPIAKLDGRLRPDLLKRNDFLDVGVDATLTFQNDTDWDRFVGGSESQLMLIATADTIAGAVKTQFIADVPVFRYATFAPNINGPGRIDINATGTGVAATGSGGYSLCFTLVNTKQNPYLVNIAT